MSRCDGSWGNYPLSQCVCSYKLKQGFPSGSSPAQVSEQLMTFGSNRMKEMAVVCSARRTTFVLLWAVCLNLPATLFTPQGDHVIRSPPLAHLSSCSTTPSEKDCSSWEKENNINRQEATASNAHHLLAHSHSDYHYILQESHSFSMLCLPCATPPNFNWQTSTSLLSLPLTHCFVLHCTWCTAFCYIYTQSSPPPLSRSLATVKKYC